MYQSCFPLPFSLFPFSSITKLSHLSSPQLKIIVENHACISFPYPNPSTYPVPIPISPSIVSLFSKPFTPPHPPLHQVKHSTKSRLLILNRHLFPRSISILAPNKIRYLLIFRLFDCAFVVLGALAEDLFLEHVDCCLGVSLSLRTLFLKKTMEGQGKERGEG